MVATVTPTNDQLVKALQVGQLKGEKGKQLQQQNAFGEILKIVSTNLNQPGESGPYQDQTTYPKETEGQKLEKKGGYIDTGELDPSGEPLMIKGNPLDELFIDPKTQRKNVRDRKIEDRSKSNDQGADIAKEKLRPDQKIDIPDFLQNINIKPQDLLKILQLIPAATGFNLQMAKADDDYGPGSKKYPQTPGKPWQVADISDSIKRENVGGTLRDLVLPLAIKEYGKTPSGGYKNPGALLSIMKKLG